MGRESHPKIIKEFGGEYGTPALKRYVDGIGQLLSKTSEQPDLQFTFTVLNSDIVNAFATPGGYVCGLMPWRITKHGLPAFWCMQSDISRRFIMHGVTDSRFCRISALRRSAFWGARDRQGRPARRDNAAPGLFARERV
jgi:hypothetical protein